VLDDDLPIAELVRVVLEEAGMSVTVRTSGDELPAGPFDRIVTDLLTMTAYDQREARDWILRLADRYPGVPVIVATAHLQAARDLAALGVRRVLVKPFDVDQLVAAVTS
jgi:two-component system nitrogen regulation response regulator GlnG